MCIPLHAKIVVGRHSKNLLVERTVTYILPHTTQCKLQNVLISIHVGTLVNAWLVEEKLLQKSCRGGGSMGTSHVCTLVNALVGTR